MFVWLIQLPLEVKDRDDKEVTPGDYGKEKHLKYR